MGLPIRWKQIKKTGNRVEILHEKQKEVFQIDILPNNDLEENESSSKVIFKGKSNNL